MKNKLLLILLLLIIPFASAQIQLYGGETETIYTNNAISCSIVNVHVNSSTVIQNNNKGLREYNLTSCELVFKSDFNDNWICNCYGENFDLILSVLPNTINNYIFSLTFLNGNNEGGDENIQIIVSSSGGSSSGICRTEWTCTEWSECNIGGFQTRHCSYPINWCEPNQPKPTEIQNCTIEEESSEEPEEILILTNEPANSFGKITSAVIGVLGTNGTIGVFIFIFCIIGTAIFLIFKKRRN